MTSADDRSPCGHGEPITWRNANRLVLLLVLVFGVLYVGKAWSPSSYGHVLRHHLGYAEGGPDWGKPRPIRSDEWGVVTPLTQATINSNFERYNRTSLYGEDLRMNFGLPVHDWGLAFKPTLWLYGVVNPAYAYSFHWFALSALFLVGYAWLFRWLGATPVVGFALSAGWYYTGFVQFWWNEKGPEFALFPWVILPLASRLPLVWKAALFYWMAVAWLLTNFYPPVQLSLAFVGLVLLLAREPDLFKPRPLLVLLLAAALAAGTAAFYLWDYLQATATTIYPGQRNLVGGDLPWEYLRSWLWPAANFDRGYQSLLPNNISEIGAPGLYYTLFVLCFLDYSRWRTVWADGERRRQVLVLGGALAMMLAWLLLPLPSWVGAPLLWNHVQPARMQYATGLLLVCWLFLLAHCLGLRVSWLRVGIVLAALVFGWWAWKFEPGRNRYEDLYVAVLFLPVFALAYRRSGTAHASLALASLLAGIVLFGRFNPLQSAWPIFNPAPNEMTRILDRLAADNGGVLAVTGLPGAVGNGLGYRSLSHVTAVPQLAFWRRHFPDLPAAEFETIFNRYAHIIPDEEDRPRLRLADAVGVPLDLFQGMALRGAVHYVPPPVPWPEVDGHIDKVAFAPGRLLIVGWGPWSGPPEGHELEISVIPAASGPPRRSLLIRADLPVGTGQRVSALNGFSLLVPFADGVVPTALCVVAHDSHTGRRTLLRNPPDVPLCQNAHGPSR